MVRAKCSRPRVRAALCALKRAALGRRVERVPAVYQLGARYGADGARSSRVGRAWLAARVAPYRARMGCTYRRHRSWQSRPDKCRFAQSSVRHRLDPSQHQFRAVVTTQGKFAEPDAITAHIREEVVWQTLSNRH